MKPGSPLTVLLDEGTPVGVAEPFLLLGHRVIHHREVLSPGAKDSLVAATAQMNKAALIALDRDMRQITRRFGSAKGTRKFESLNLIFLECGGVLAPKRVAHLMSFIEHEWAVICKKTARNMWLEIGPHHFSSFR